MNIKQTLINFLEQPLNTADSIFNIFKEVHGATIYQGEKPGERFLFIEGHRPDAATLVAHADTVFKHAGNPTLKEEGDWILSGRSEYGIGADDRAGCAMLWLLKDLGHHILICDYEEGNHEDAVGGCVGSKYLMRAHHDIAKIINASSFAFEFDRRLAYGTRKEHYTCYDLPVSKEFRAFIENNTAFIDDDNKGCTDIMEICTEICGANICVGYANAHTAEEKISISAFENTYHLMNELLRKPLQRYPLTVKR